MSQVALLDLQSISYSGSNVGNNLHIQFQAASDATSVDVIMTLGSTLPVSARLGGQVQGSSGTPVSIPLQVTVTSNNPGMPVHGTTNTIIVVAPTPSIQSFTVPVTVSPTVGPSATISVVIQSTYRDLPVCYSPDWLCWNRYNFPVFYAWWCLGASSLGNFSTLQPVVDLTSTLGGYLSDLTRMNTELSLGYTAPTTALFSRLDYALNVVQAAATQMSSLSWRNRYVIEDFTTAIDLHASDFVGIIGPVLLPAPLSICKKWRELLDCFCRYCVSPTIYPVAVQNYYDTNVAPVINTLYPTIASLAASEGISYYIDPYVTQQCDKLRYMVSFWAWWCRVCNRIAPVWESSLDPYYDSLVAYRDQMDFMLEASSITICDPPEKNYCQRWLDLLDCLYNLCRYKAKLPSALLSDLESTFKTLMHSAYWNVVYGPPTTFASVCDYVTGLRAYFQFLCAHKTIPNARRTAMDNYLVQLETAMSAFTADNGNLCDPATPTICDDLVPVIDCLDRLCAHKGAFTTSLQSYFSSLFGGKIDNIFALITFLDSPPPTPPDPGPMGLDALCWKIRQISDFLAGVCPEGTIDPVLQLLLTDQISALQSQYTTLLALFPDICSETITLTETYCDNWSAILGCLRRICNLRGQLYTDIIDEVVSLFASLAEYLRWLLDGTSTYYVASGELTADQLCADIATSLDKLVDICDLNEIDPVIKLQLDAQLALFQAAYAELLTDYPSVCSTASSDTFCQDWMAILDCLAKLCDHRDELIADPDTSWVMFHIANNMGPDLSGSYYLIFGQNSPTLDNFVDRACYEIHAMLDWFAANCGCNVSVSGLLATSLEYHLGRLQELYDYMATCRCECVTDSLTLTTGEARWRVTETDNAVTPPFPANIVTGTASIDPPIAGSDWISPLTSASNPVVGWTTFERSFCLCGDGDVRVVLEFLADDYAEVYVDGTLIKAAGEANMTHSDSVDQTVSLTTGCHAIRIKVRNDPAYNMALCALGSIRNGDGRLVRDECCDCESSEPVEGSIVVADICCAVDSQCDILTTIPFLADVFCCQNVDTGDSVYTSAAADVLDLVGSFESGAIPELILQFGLDPASVTIPGGDLCTRLRFSLRMALKGYAVFRKLTVLLRYRLDCFIRQLRLRIAQYSYASQDLPLLCGQDDFCTRWLALLNCLCRVCAGTGLPTGHPGDLDDQISSLYSYVAALPSGLGGEIFPAETPSDSCDRISRIVLYFATLCLDCGSLAEPYRTELLDRYDQLSSHFATYDASFTPPVSGACDTLCVDWRSRLGCLLKLALRRAELTAAQRDRFDVLFGPVITNLHVILFQSTGAISPFAAGAFNDNDWRLLEVVRELAWRCSPFNVWDDGTRSDLSTIYPAFAANYATYLSELSAAGVHICDADAPLCEKIQKITSAYGLLCATSPDTGAVPVVAVDVLLAQIQGVISSLQRQLRLNMAAYPSGGTFCARLEFVCALMTTALARYDELAPQLQVMVDLFYFLLQSQSAAYAATIPDRLPLDPTPMSEYRASWTDLLSCLCKACDFVGTLTTEQKEGTYEDVVTKLDAAIPTIDALFDAVVALASTIGLPLIDDPCLDGDLCKELRIILGFFASYCLSCDEPDGSVTGALADLLESLRAVTVDLRGALATSGAGVCGDENYGNISLQSSWLYLQAVGAQTVGSGGDGSAPGVQLRWALTGDLGLQHLPKGNLARTGSDYYTTAGFSKPDDFVSLYRAAYDESEPFPATIDLTVDEPSAVVPGDATSPWYWTYDVRADQKFPDPVTTVILTFLDAYPLPGTPVPDRGTPGYMPYIQSVIASYSGVYALETSNKTMFGFQVIPDTTSGATAKIEAISYNDDPNVENPLFLSARKQFSGGLTPYKIFSEEITTVRFQCINCHPKILLSETYYDFYVGTKRRYHWTKLGEYALTLETTEAYRRLEDPPNVSIDGIWPKFESGSAQTPPAGRVNVKNYWDRWIPNRQYNKDGSANPDYDPTRPDYDRDPEQSLRAAVIRYLNESRDPDNLEAWIDQPSVMEGDQTVINLSILKLLGLASQDYHIARMLGLGAVDWQVPLAGASSSQRYVYFVEYTTPGVPGSIYDETITHRFLSLPTGRQDSRLPARPTLSSLDVGLDPFTIDGGYTRFGDSRIVKINRADLPFDLPATDTFFATTDQYSRGLNTRPILYGIKYGPYDPAHPTLWPFPDPSNDLAEFDPASYRPYLDGRNNPEITPIPEVANPIFVHMVKNTPANSGWQKYGIYGINWFSRASSTSSPLLIENDFPVRNTLLPPANLAAQYIQDENPRMFISANEKANIGTYGGLTRVTFDWNHTHNIAFDRADAVDFYFRSEPPKAIKGMIADVIETGTTHRLKITTKAFLDRSVEMPGGEWVTPAVDADDITDGIYVGSVLATREQRWIVVQAMQETGGLASFIIDEIQEAGADGSSDSGPWIRPVADDYIMVVENLGLMTRWTPLPDARIMLEDFISGPYTSAADIYTETVIENDRPATYTFGGLVDDDATVVPAVVGTDPVEIQGAFKVTFSSGHKLFSYATHFPGDTHLVEFYKGTARIPEYGSSDTVKTLEVLKIVSLDPLVFFVFDPDALNNPGSYQSIAPPNPATSVKVNFHPSYRVYLNLPADSIDPATQILPVPPDRSRTTYIAARSVDTTHTDSGGAPFRSAITAPAVQLARALYEPEIPETPDGPDFATRPDFYGKSTYSFDTTIPAGRDPLPYGMMFFRADEMAILSALYTQQTIIDDILPNLDPPDEDDSFHDRWSELITVVTDSSGLFRDYGDGFHFPNPDRATDPLNPGRYASFNGTNTPDAIADDIRSAIHEAFLPLTARPVVLDLVTSDDALQTSSARPTIRNRNGDPLSKGQAGFDPYPMVRTGLPDGVRKVRFSDYTLDGASRNYYFYCTREITGDMKNGGPSGVKGPIRLVNTKPPVAPQINHVKSQSADPVQGIRTSVVFRMLRYPAGETIGKVRIYRTLSAALALATRSMELVAEITLPDGPPSNDPYELSDVFTGQIPFGRPLYYRLVALRTIRNERGEVEYVESVPSDTIMSNVVDVGTPTSPAISYTSDTPVGSPVVTIPNVELTWGQSVYNGTYYLYRMTVKGNWGVIHKVKPDPDDFGATMSYNVGDLAKQDDQGNEVLIRFKVVAQSSSGLVSTDEKMLVL